MKKLVDNLRLGDRVVGWVSQCETCTVLFISRRFAQYCSDACRVAAYRGRKRLSQLASVEHEGGIAPGVSGGLNV